MSLDKRSVVLVSVAGVISHLLFKKYEPRRLSSILSFLLGPLAITSWLCPSNRSSFAALLTSCVVYLASLIASVVTYRLSPFHPLASFPGPVICKVTRLWAFYVTQTGNQHRYYQSLHARYGPYIRAGPNHIHISDAAMLSTTMGIKHFIRGERYGVARLPGTTGSLITIIDPQEHAQRRKIWDKSLNTKAVLGYQGMLSARIGQLVDALEKREGSEVDLALWLSCLSFDFMGDLAFGGAFRLMEQGSDVDGYMRLAKRNMQFQEIFGTIPWIGSFLSIMPAALTAGRSRFLEFSRASVLARKAQGASTKDIFYHLLDEAGIGTGPPSLPTLISESGLAIVAGSDTTGTALSNVFFYLLFNPNILARLREEVDSVFPPRKDTSFPGAVAEMKLLNAVINETLRLQPAIPNGAQRSLPIGRGGVNVAGRWFPEGTTVQISAYSVHRDPRYFYPDPESFRPDRWLEVTPGSKLDPSAYFPFSLGPTSCVGKNLALLELRTVVCSLIRKFDFELAPGFTSADWENKLEDFFILTKGDLPVRVRTRNL